MNAALALADHCAYVGSRNDAAPQVVDVANPGSYPTADDTFNHVTFDSVTTTKLRVVLQSGQGSVGVIQWVVPSIPSSH